MVVSKVVPSPRGWPLIGTLGELIAAGGATKLHEYVHRRHQQLGSIYKEKIGPVTGVFISRPDYMRRVFALEGRYPNHIIPEAWALYNTTYNKQRGLLFMEGEDWHFHRKILNNIFLRPNNYNLIEAVSEVADDLIETWAKDPAPRHLDHILYTWSLQSMIAMLVGAQSYKIHQQRNGKTVQKLSQLLRGIFEESSKLSLISATFAQRWNLPPWKRFLETAHSTQSIANNLLEDLKTSPSAEESILQQMKDTEISEDRLNSIVIDMIMAAGDTTAYTTQWLLYLLAKHPSVQQKVYEEVSNNSVESALDSSLVRGVLRETLRLYPVAPFVTRYMPDNVQIDGYGLEKDDLVIMSLYTSGRDEESFPAAAEFQPDRWTREGNSYKNVKNAQGSMPFAMGARSCIGRKLAEVQIATALAKILRTYKLHLLNQESVDIKLNLIAVPSIPISLRFESR